MKPAHANSGWHRRIRTSRRCRRSSACAFARHARSSRPPRRVPADRCSRSRSNCALAAGRCGSKAEASASGKQIGICRLHLGKIGCGFHHAPNTVLVKFVGGGARCAATQIHAHRERIVLFGDILGNGVIGKASERRLGRRRSAVRSRRPSSASACGQRFLELFP